MSEPLACPECGAEEMKRTEQNCRLDDGFVVKRLRHFKCGSCGARFFDDAAMHRIQAERAERRSAHTV